MPITRAAAPIPIPAFAPVPRPLLDAGAFVFSGVAGTVTVTPAALMEREGVVLSVEDSEGVVVEEEDEVEDSVEEELEVVVVVVVVVFSEVVEDETPPRFMLQRTSLPCS